MVNEEQWWDGLAPEQRRELLELHTSDVVPPHLLNLVGEVAGAASTSFVPSMEFTVGKTLGDFLDSKRQEM